MSGRSKITIPQKYIDKYGKVNMWSYSKISSFSDGCHWEYYLSRILKKKGTNNSYAILGGICHDILESFYNGEIKYEEMKTIFETKWLECEMAGIKLYGDEEKNVKMMEEYKQDILNFFETHQIPGNGKKVSEAEIWIDLEHDGDICIGYIDAILKQGDRYIIEDYKTSTLYKGKDIYDHQKQLLLYSLGLNQLGVPLDKIDIRWLFLKYTNVTFKHMTTVTYVETVKDKSKEKTSTCLKSEWVSKVKTQLKKDIIAHYGEALSSKEVKALLDECVDNNNLNTLPKELQDKYILNGVTKTVRRHKWVKESPIQTQLRKDLKLAEVDDITTEMKLVECADLNSLEPIKDLIDISNYILEDAYVYGIINDETISDLKKSLCENIEIIKANGEDEAKWERLLPVSEADSFYCSVLCGQRKNCKYYEQYKKDKERYTAEGCVNNQNETMSNDNLLDELMNL
jgi:hypothetical protein